MTPEQLAVHHAFWAGLDAALSRWLEAHGLHEQAELADLRSLDNALALREVRGR